MRASPLAATALSFASLLIAVGCGRADIPLGLGAQGTGGQPLLTCSQQKCVPICSG